MPKPYPKEFRDDVLAVARKGQAPLNQIAKDFGISEGCLHNWMKKADVADGRRPGLTEDERKELRELNERIRLTAQENEVLRRAAGYLSQANLPGSVRRATYQYLGTAGYVSDEGSCPMAVVWKLDHPIPADLYPDFAAAGVA